MVLGPAYRGHAPVTFDTVTAQAIIDEVNAHGTTLAAAPTAYAPSASAYYLETNNGNGTGTVQTIANTTWTKLDVAGTVATNNGGGFNAGTDIYTIPVSGIYICQALVRIADSYPTNANLGIGFHTSEVDGYWFQWNKIMPLNTGGSRLSVDYTRVASYTAGWQSRLYCFQDSGSPMAITAINLSVWRIG